MHTLNGTTYGTAGEAIAALDPEYATADTARRDELRFDLAIRFATAGQAVALASVDTQNVPDEAVGVLLSAKDEMAPEHGLDDLGVPLIVVDLPYLASKTATPVGATVIEAVDEVSLLQSLNDAELIDYSMV